MVIKRDIRIGVQMPRQGRFKNPRNVAARYNLAKGRALKTDGVGLVSTTVVVRTNNRDTFINSVEMPRGVTGTERVVPVPGAQDITDIATDGMEALVLIGNMEGIGLVDLAILQSLRYLFFLPAEVEGDYRCISVDDQLASIWQFRDHHPSLADAIQILYYNDLILPFVDHGPENGYVASFSNWLTLHMRERGWSKEDVVYKLREFGYRTTTNKIDRAVQGNGTRIDAELVYYLGKLFQHNFHSLNS